jgi:putative DNA primase/helicase
MSEYELYSDPEYGKFSDIGNAIRLADRFEFDLRYCPTHGWLRYAGYKMNVLNQAPLDEATALPELIRSEITADHTRDDVAEFEKWAMKSASIGRARAALDFMADFPTIRVNHEQLDRNPFDFNTLKGIYDLRDISFRESLAADLITKGTIHVPAPPETAPTWLTFLEQVLPSKDVRSFLQRAVGYSMTGLTREEVFFMLYGSGQNGKSKLLGALANALGTYAHAFDPKLVMQQKYEGHPTNMASLHGVRFAYTSEIDQGAILDEGRVKAITGGDVMTARFMRKDEFSWAPTHKLWIATNHLPVIKGTDKGMWRRIMVIPFDVAVPDEARDNLLAEKLAKEARGILGWALEGAQEYFKYGLQPPAEVLMASAHYQEEQDGTQRFVSECTTPTPKGEVRAGDLYNRYKRWCDESGETCLNQTAFGRELNRLGYHRAMRGGGIRYRVGLELVEGVWA